jgi:autotransporter-associated beta strand protein
MKTKLNFSHALALASALGIWAARAHAQYDVILTPDQFVAQDPWNGNLFRDTVDAYQGDNAAGYYWTQFYDANSPSGTIKVPLPAGMPLGWHQYAVCEWNPTVHSQQYWVVDIAADGTNNNNPTMPWIGQFGTNHQWLQNDQSKPANLGGWLQLGPGPQSDSSVYADNGYGVWMSPNTGNGYPYLYIHLDLAGQNLPQSFDAFHVVQIDGPTWLSDTDVAWSTFGPWISGGNFTLAPNASGAVANFLHAATAPRTVTVDLPVTVGVINFSNINGYTLATADSASDNITMDNSGSNSIIEVLQGSQRIDAPMVLGGNGVLDMSLCMAGSFTITGNIGEAAAGAGVLKMDTASTGTLVLSGTNTYSSTEVWAGTLIVQHPYSLLNGSNLTVGNAAAAFAAPVVAGGNVPAAVPEPGTLALLAAGGAAVLLRLRRRRRGVVIAPRRQADTLDCKLQIA